MVVKCLFCLEKNKWELSIILTFEYSLRNFSQYKNVNTRTKQDYYISKKRQKWSLYVNVMNAKRRNGRIQCCVSGWFQNNGGCLWLWSLYAKPCVGTLYKLFSLILVTNHETRFKWQKLVVRLEFRLRSYLTLQLILLMTLL